MNTRIILGTGSSNPDFNGDCDYAVVELTPEVVDAEQIAQVVSRWTGVPVDKMLEGERAKLLRMEDALRRRSIRVRPEDHLPGPSRCACQRMHIDQQHIVHAVEGHCVAILCRNYLRMAKHMRRMSAQCRGLVEPP